MDELEEKIANALQQANITFDRQHNTFWFDSDNGDTYSFTVEKCEK